MLWVGFGGFVLHWKAHQEMEKSGSFETENVSYTAIQQGPAAWFFYYIGHPTATEHCKWGTAGKETFYKSGSANPPPFIA